MARIELAALRILTSSTPLTFLYRLEPVPEGVVEPWRLWLSAEEDEAPKWEPPWPGDEAPKGESSPRPPLFSISFQYHELVLPREPAGDVDAPSTESVGIAFLLMVSPSPFPFPFPFRKLFN